MLSDESDLESGEPERTKSPDRADLPGESPSVVQGGDTPGGVRIIRRGGSQTDQNRLKRKIGNPRS